MGCNQILLNCLHFANAEALFSLLNDVELAESAMTKIASVSAFSFILRPFRSSCLIFADIFFSKALASAISVKILGFFLIYLRM